MYVEHICKTGRLLLWTIIFTAGQLYLPYMNTFVDIIILLLVVPFQNVAHALYVVLKMWLGNGE